MCGFTKLYVDDERELPEQCKDEGCWQISRTVWEAITKLELLEFEELSLDHDLACFVGNHELTGYDILLWLVDRKQKGLHVPKRIYVHSANPVGYVRMVGVINRYLKD